MNGFVGIEVESRQNIVMDYSRREALTDIDGDRPVREAMLLTPSQERLRRRCTRDQAGAESPNERFRA
ncbi:hypothetical protein BB934_32395 (plasmid) [Microvirga ossetica]|uniref:Uncharacterized protein n=1 Tax=Microvirga ossetica TaxID=1882682 RepID=A0A1B2ESX0_9HYPH|nr:hypothetical protein BB934_32395 [Microvirga ossetica]